jgi:hypothetical protein
MWRVRARLMPSITTAHSAAQGLPCRTPWNPTNHRTAQTNIVNPDTTSWGGWTRTTNFLINSQAVCQLTYAPNDHRTQSNYEPTKSPPVSLAGFAERVVRARSASLAPRARIIAIIRAIEPPGARRRVHDRRLVL